MMSEKQQYRMVQIVDDKVSPIGRVDSSCRVNDSYLIELALTPEQNRELCQAMQRHDDTVWAVRNEAGEVLLCGRVTHISLARARCCSDTERLVGVYVTLEVMKKNPGGQ